MRIAALFKTFAPLTTRIPSEPFARLPEIAERARSLLAGKSDSEVRAAAAWLADAISVQRRSDVRERQQVDLRVLQRAIASDAEPVNPDDLAELICDTDGQATHEQIEEARLVRPPLNERQRFAVLALLKVAATLHQLRGRPAGGSRKPGKKGPAGMVPSDPLRLAAAAELAIEAMEAVCWAEQLDLVRHQSKHIEHVHQNIEQLGRRHAQPQAQRIARERESAAARKRARQRKDRPPGAKEWIRQQWKAQRSEYEGNKSAFARDHEKFLKGQFEGVRVNWHTIATRWLKGL